MHIQDKTNTASTTMPSRRDQYEEFNESRINQYEEFNESPLI